MKGDPVSDRNRRRGTIANRREGSKVAEDGGYELVSTDAACGEESLIESEKPRVWRDWWRLRMAGTR